MALKHIFGEDYWALEEDGKEILRVGESIEENVPVMTLTGSLRSDTLHEFQDELMMFVTQNTDIILDCEGLNSISNSCMEALLNVQKELDARKTGKYLKLRNVNGEIGSQFKKIHLSELIRIEYAGEKK